MWGFSGDISCHFITIFIHSSKCLRYGIEFGQNEFLVLRYVKSRIFTGHKIHSDHVTMASIETSLQTKIMCISLTKNNAKLIKRIVKK